MYFQLFFIAISTSLVFGDYYEILGISKSATDFDIKKSYKKLARKWHPDKNRSPEANEHFTKINEAYEALSNSEKRKEYDAFGSISNDPRGNEGGGNYYGGGNFGNAYFDFGRNENSNSRVESTNYRHYKINILPASYKQPTLILLVSHFCFSCHQAMRLWGNIADQVIESGIRITLCDMMSDGHLREELRVQHVPTVVMIIDGQVKYMQSEINKETVIDFIRYSFPRDLVETIQSEVELNQFHDSWLKDSRSKMIMTKPLDRPSFRYLSIAFKYRAEVSAGFIQLDENNNQLKRISSAYNLRNDEETVLIFHDEKLYEPHNAVLPKPIDKKSKSRLTLSLIEDLVKSNYLLPFPRLLSQSVFDLACPPPSQKQRSFGFCVITIVHSKHKNNLSQSDSWQYVRSLIGDRGHGKMMYLFGDVQYQFLQSLQLVDPSKSSIDTFMDQVILLWRHSYTSATSLFLSNPWQYSNIEMVLHNWDLLSNFERAVSILKSNNQRPNKVTDSESLAELVDELEAPLWRKIFSRFASYAQYVLIWLYEFLIEPFNLIILVLGLVLASYVYSTIKAVSAHLSSEINEEPLPADTNIKKTKTTFANNIVTQFTDESYVSLLQNLQPGRLICVMLTTRDTPSDILSLLQNSITKLKCNNHLAALSISLDSHPLWLRSLLSNISNDDDHKSALSSISSLSVNRPQPYEGIVLALNIGRCYVSICPINLLQWSQKRTQARSAARRRRGNSDRPVDGYVPSYDIGSSDSDSSSSLSSCASSVEGDTRHCVDVGGRFFDWLSQLMEGSCRRYHVREWPRRLS